MRTINTASSSQKRSPTERHTWSPPGSFLFLAISFTISLRAVHDHSRQAGSRVRGRVFCPFFSIGTKEMKDIVGTPGTRSGLALRVSQAVCAGGSLIAMCSAYGFSNYSAFCYLTVAMMVQFLWSFILVCVDIRSLKNNWDIHTSEHAWKYVVGDWLFGLTSAAAASSSAGLAILLERDVHFCRSYPYLSCSRYKVSVILAFMAWSFIAASATSTFWLMVKLA